ncbi:Tigger transposable element-derived protein 6 [Cucumispora dikerogammari]|nr:Tigger transposable element-derived protein 6 [Cucumispora dikerogammari]
MTSKIFNNWLSLLNTEQLKKKRKNSLLIVNASCHNVFTETNLSHIDIFFLPPNTNSVLQSLDQRIIHSFKSFYKKFLIKLMISKYESEERLKVNILNAIEIIVESWDKVIEKIINNCFSHTFFDRKENSINEVCETSSEINTLSNIIHCVDKDKILHDVQELSIFEYLNIAAIEDELIDTDTVDKASVEDESAVIVKPTLRDVEGAVKNTKVVFAYNRRIKIRGIYAFKVNSI